MESLFFSLLVDFSSLGRREPPLVVATMAGGERNADGAVVPVEESVAVAPEAGDGFDADNGAAGMVSVRVEDSLDEGELRLLACRELSEDARERLGLGTLGNGSAGGGELEPGPTRLVSVEEAAVDGDLGGFGGDVDVGTDDDRVAVAEEAGKLAPIDDPAAVVLSIRESEAERALSLDGACFKTVLFSIGRVQKNRDSRRL